jgi:lysine-specific demethylase 3
VNILKEELNHMTDIAVIYRRRESEVRATCGMRTQKLRRDFSKPHFADTCMTSLFCGSWMCRVCGREACGDCYASIKDLTEERPDATPQQAAEINAHRDKHANANPFFLNCTKRNDHVVTDFSPVTRFCRAELQEAVAKMTAVLAEAETDSAEVPTLRPADIPSVTPPASAQDEEVPCHDIVRFTDGGLTDQGFREHWATGLPLLVSGLLPKFKKPWSPQYFAEEFGDQGCLIIECQDDTNKRVTIADFFTQFGQYNERTECWKLKDWPPSSDFKTAYPVLFEDFSSYARLRTTRWSYEHRVAFPLQYNLTRPGTKDVQCDGIQ